MPENNAVQLINFFANLDIWQVVKGIFLVGLFLYLVFALVIVRQVGLMLDVLQVELEWLIKFAAWLHLFLVIGVFLFGLLYL